jgi:hypothetical protein
MEDSLCFVWAYFDSWVPCGCKCASFPCDVLHGVLRMFFPLSILLVVHNIQASFKGEVGGIIMCLPYQFTKAVAASFSSSSILFRLPGLTYHRRMLLRYLMAEVTVAAATGEAIVG